MRLTLPALILLSGCDDTIFGKGGEGGDSASYEEGYAGVVAIMEDHCISCHPAGGGSGGLDVETDLCATTVGVAAQGYDGVLVVAGDSENSVLWAKMANNGAYGGVMPLSGALDAEVVDIIAAWIDDGAACN